jgi:hypothetical protein
MSEPKPRRRRGKRTIAVGEARRPFESARRAPTSPGGLWQSRGFNRLVSQTPL